MFSRWTHKFFPTRMPGKTTILRGVQFVDKDDLIAGKLPGELRDWQVKCVCGGNNLSCNNGWMRSVVEEPSIEIISKLILGSSVRISPDQQQKIATWAALNCMIAEYDSGGFATTHHMQRKRLRLKYLPPIRGWGIWIGACPQISSRLSWQSYAFFVKPKRLIKDVNTVPSYYNGQSSTIIIGKLLIQVVRGPISGKFNDWKFPMENGGQLLQIWPPTSFGIQGPLKTMSVREVNMTSSSVSRFLLSVAKKRA